MIVTNAQHPRPEQAMAFFGADDGQPICMVNLLKFREKAQYSDGRPTTLTGREAYLIYGRAMLGIVAAAGGKMVFSGQIRGLHLGDVERLWDAVGIMMYPSYKAMQAITGSPEYADIHVHREAGLEGQLNIETRMG